MRLLPVIIFVCLSRLVTQSYAQTPSAHKMSDAESKLHRSKKMVASAQTAFNSVVKTKAKERGQAMAALILKAILHRADPVHYPMDIETPSVEKNIWQVVQNIHPSLFDTIAVKAKETIGNPVKKANLLGKFDKIDLKKSTIWPAISAGSGPKFTLVKDRPKLEQSQQTTGGYDKVDIEVNSIDCIARTTLANPYDRIILTGLLIGASGNTNDANSMVTCEMIDGITCTMGDYKFGSYSLHTTPAFPKTFYCVFVLVRSGREEPMITRNLFDIIMSLISAASVSPAMDMEEMTAAVTSCMNEFSDNWLWDDRPLIPYPVKFTLNSVIMANGSDGATDEFQTGDILEYGNPQRWGKYRISYRWRIGK